MANQDVVDGVLTWLGWSEPTPTQTSVVERAVSRAENKIRSIRAQDYTEDIEPQFVDIAIDMACYQIEKQGVDNVSSFSENGIARTYEDGSYPSSLLSQIPPKANIFWRV